MTNSYLITDNEIIKESDILLIVLGTLIVIVLGIYFYYRKCKILKETTNK